MIINFIQGLLLILLTPLFSGIIKKFKANIRGYKGPSIFQVYYDLKKLIGKGSVISSTSSFVTLIGPILSLATAITAALIIPIFYADDSGIVGNFFIAIFLLAIIKLFNTLIGLDCASTFGGMGSSRELFISMFAEPIIFILIAFLYFETKSFNLHNIAIRNAFTLNYGVAHIIAAAAFFVVILAENTRMPIDNPETHLELTMVHEAMILDLSGRELAFVELSSSIKLMVFLTIFINGFMPFGIATTCALVPLIKAIVLYLIKLIICLLVISLVETTIAKFRLFRIPELLAMAFSISVIAVVISNFV